ncbi:unnamed protein product [Brachionus calyciflorus]|uniref:Microtubule-associated protein Jupiter n=1 Tax=Brachionus calyciflorus TaxID=104777 RepID=A0A813VTF6_9BILA|nr:unnamed protein product [Brachionus calyciflorus]
MTSANFYSGYVIDKPTSKVLNPPGGRSNNIFGVSDDAPKANAPHQPTKAETANQTRNASNVFNDNTTNNVQNKKRSGFNPITGQAYEEETPKQPSVQKTETEAPVEKKQEQAPVEEKKQQDTNAPGYQPRPVHTSSKVLQPPGGASTKLCYVKESEDIDLNEAEFYVDDEEADGTCMMNKDDDLALKRCLVNPASLNLKDLSYFNQENEAKILEYAVKSDRKLLVIYILITKSGKQRENLIKVLTDKNGKAWLKKLRNVGSLVWKNSAKIIEALVTPSEEFNAKMLSKRFEFMTTSVKKLFKMIPDTLQSIFQRKKKIFNSYMLTEILLESTYEERQKLRDTYFLKFKQKLENEIALKLNRFSTKFHQMLLNETRELPKSKEIIERLTNELKIAIHEKRQKVDSKTEFKLTFLSLIIGKYSPEIMTEVFKKIKYDYNYSMMDIIKKGCVKLSFIDLAVKFLHDPYAYYASHIKILLDKKDFGYYLSRLFFAYPKQKLYEIAKAFRQIYKAPLKDYIRSRLNELNPSTFEKTIGRYEEYSSYLRAMLASIGDVEWCSGPCRITQIDGKGGKEK